MVNAISRVAPFFLSFFGAYATLLYLKCSEIKMPTRIFPVSTKTLAGKKKCLKLSSLPVARVVQTSKNVILFSFQNFDTDHIWHVTERITLGRIWKNITRGLLLSLSLSSTLLTLSVCYLFSMAVFLLYLISFQLGCQ